MWSGHLVHGWFAACNLDALGFDPATGSLGSESIGVGDSFTVDCDPDFDLVGPASYNCTGPGTLDPAFTSECLPGGPI